MDALDRRILREVQRDCLVSATQLAERCATTESTALRRLKRLSRDGIIRGCVAVVDGPKAGRGLMMIVNVRTKRGMKANVPAFKAAMLAHPAVMQFYFVTGSNDFVIILSVRSMEEYDAFIEFVLSVDPQLLTDTNVVIRPLKLGLEIPIDEPTA